MPKTRRHRRQTRKTRKGKGSRRGGSRRFFPSETAEITAVRNILNRYETVSTDEKIRLLPEVCETLLMSRFVFKTERFYNILLEKLNVFKQDYRLQQFIHLIDETIDHAHRAHAGEFNSMSASRY